MELYHEMSHVTSFHGTSVELSHEMSHGTSMEGSHFMEPIDGKKQLT